MDNNEHAPRSIDRINDSETVAVTDDIATSGSIQFSGCCGGMVYVPSGSSITSLAFHSAPTKDGTFLPIYNELGVAASIAVTAGRAYQIPSACYGAPWLRILSDASESLDFTKVG